MLIISHELELVDKAYSVLVRKNFQRNTQHERRIEITRYTVCLLRFLFSTVAVVVAIFLTSAN